MEDLKPDDIVGYQFKQSLRGFAVDEVDKLLDRVADQIERMAAELADLRGRVQVAETQAAATRETEATLQRTLVVAQQAAERNLADAAAQAEATLANATADAERLRREVEEEIGRTRADAEEHATRTRADAEEHATRLRADAEDAAAATLERAQELARREVRAARARVEEAANRHAEVIGRVGEHRDALRRELANLEELALAVGPAPQAELVVGELLAEPVGAGDHEHDAGPVVDSDSITDRGGEDGPGTVRGPQRPGVERDTAGDAPTPPSPLTIRVHEERQPRSSGGSAPLGSGERDDA